MLQNQTLPVPVLIPFQIVWFYIKKNMLNTNGELKTRQEIQLKYWFKKNNDKIHGFWFNKKVETADSKTQNPIQLNCLRKLEKKQKTEIKYFYWESTQNV